VVFRMSREKSEGSKWVRDVLQHNRRGDIVFEADRAPEHIIRAREKIWFRSNDHMHHIFGQTCLSLV